MQALQNDDLSGILEMNPQILEELKRSPEMDVKVVNFSSREHVLRVMANTEADFVLVLNDNKPLTTVAEIMEEIGEGDKNIPVLFFNFKDFYQ